MNTGTLYARLAKNNFSVSTDTRTLRAGDIYFGIKGDQFDGNAYADTAIEKGAALAVIDDASYKKDDRYVLVSDTVQTLQELARHYRTTFSIPFIAIGGSNGKTTTKELVHAVLSTQYKVHTTSGNLNNEIGVPLTILSLPKDTDIAVIEIGANHAHEHTTLINIVSPTHVLVTNNGADHLEGFGSLEGVRAANKEIYDNALQLNAHAFVNKDLTDLVADSEGLVRTLYPEKTWQSNSTVYAAVTYNDTLYQSALFGSYNEPNLLAAIIIGEHFSVPTNSVQKALAEYEPTLKRSQLIQKDGYMLILDCYNANPTSMELSLKDLFRSTTPGARILVVGDMFELGHAEESSHAAILKFISTHGGTDDIVLCVGPRFFKNKDSFHFTFFMSTQEAKPFFTALELSGTTVFLKGSRGMRLEEIF